MIFYKTDEEIELIRHNCLLVCKTLAEVAKVLKPGINSTKIDQIAESFIRDNQAKPGFKGYNGFPDTLCVSVNDVVVHGMPSSNYTFKEGDVVSIDCGVYKNGYFGDAAYTFALGDVPEKTMDLLRTTHESLYRGIERAVAGNRLGDIGFAIQNFVEREHGYGVVRELVGHGLGRELHESPQVANYGQRGRGLTLKYGLVIAIEPMVNMGKKEVYTERDGWTVRTKDGKPSAHYEHTVAVRKGRADILSDHVFIEQAIRANANIKALDAKSIAA